MSIIKKVALAGASGSLGSQVLEKLKSAGDFDITVLRREGSSAKFPANTNVVDVDFSSAEALTSVLKGQDAVVNTIGSIQLGDHIPLIDAAFAAGVKRLIPSEFGCNLDNAGVRQLPIYATKVQIRNYIEEKSKNSPTTYTYICTIAFLDWGLEHNFILDMENHKALIVGTGDELFSAITLPSIGEAVVGVLQKPEETKNRTVRVEDTKTSLHKLLGLAKKASPGTKWDVTYENLEDLLAIADKRLAEGHYDMQTFAPYLLKGTYAPGMSGAHETTDNELLGLKGKTEDEIFEVVKKISK